jgi:hypothetical protein
VAVWKHFKLMAIICINSTITSGSGPLVKSLSAVVFGWLVLDSMRIDFYIIDSVSVLTVAGSVVASASVLMNLSIV